MLCFTASEAAFAAPAMPSPASLSAVSALEVPAEFAHLKETHDGSNGKLLIHIQDPHSNLSGQENLARTLDSLMTRYGAKLVLSEGGSGDCSLTKIKHIASADIWQRVAKSYLVQGKMSGEEYLNLTTEHPMRIMGIEKDELYLDSLKNYAALAEPREKILAELQKVHANIEKLKNRLYPSELKRYEKEKNEKALLALAKENSISFEKYPELERLDRLIEKESAINFELANLEQSVMIEEIARRGGKADLDEHLRRMDKIKGQNAEIYAYFQKTLNIAKANNLDISKYENLNKYGEYLREYSQLDLDKVLDEQAELEEQVYVKILENNTDGRMLAAIDRYVSLLFSAFRIQMTTDDFNSYTLNEPDFGTVSYEAFLNSKLTELQYFDDVMPYDKILEEAKGSLKAFYDSVSKRDFAFVDNVDAAFKDSNEQTAFLITGGYHTAHLKKLLKEKGYSYAVVTPRVTSETIQSKYERLLLAPFQKEKKLVGVVDGHRSAEGEGLRLALLMSPLAGARLAEITDSAGESMNPTTTDGEKVDSLLRRLKKKNYWVRTNAMLDLGKMREKAAKAVPHIMSQLGDANHNVRRIAAFALADIGPAASAALEPLKRILSDDMERVRQAAQLAIDRISGKIPGAGARLASSRSASIAMGRLWVTAMLRDFQGHGTRHRQLMEFTNVLLADIFPGSQQITYDFAAALADDQRLDLIGQVLRRLKRERFLEIGPGQDAHIGRALIDVLGFDRRKIFAIDAHDWFKPKPDDNGGRFVKGRIETPPVKWAKHGFDRIYAAYVFSTVSDSYTRTGEREFEPAAAAKSVRALLRPAGTLMLNLATNESIAALEKEIGRYQSARGPFNSGAQYFFFRKRAARKSAVIKKGARPLDGLGARLADARKILASYSFGILLPKFRSAEDARRLIEGLRDLQTKNPQIVMSLSLGGMLYPFGATEDEPRGLTPSVLLVWSGKKVKIEYAVAGKIIKRELRKPFENRLRGLIGPVMSGIGKDGEGRQADERLSWSDLETAIELARGDGSKPYTVEWQPGSLPDDKIVLDAKTASTPATHTVFIIKLGTDATPMETLKAILYRFFVGNDEALIQYQYVRAPFIELARRKAPELLGDGSMTRRPGERSLLNDDMRIIDEMGRRSAQLASGNGEHDQPSAARLASVQFDLARARAVELAASRDEWTAAQIRRAVKSLSQKSPIKELFIDQIFSEAQDFVRWERSSPAAAARVRELARSQIQGRVRSDVALDALDAMRLPPDKQELVWVYTRAVELAQSMAVGRRVKFDLGSEHYEGRIESILKTALTLRSADSGQLYTITFDELSRAGNFIPAFAGRPRPLEALLEQIPAGNDNDAVRFRLIGANTSLDEVWTVLDAFAAHRGTTVARVKVGSQTYDDLPAWAPIPEPSLGVGTWVEVFFRSGSFVSGAGARPLDGHGARLAWNRPLTPVTIPESATDEHRRWQLRLEELDREFGAEWKRAGSASQYWTEYSQAFEDYLLTNFGDLQLPENSAVYNTVLTPTAARAFVHFLNIVDQLPAGTVAAALKKLALGDIKRTILQSESRLEQAGLSIFTVADLWSDPSFSLEEKLAATVSAVSYNHHQEEWAGLVSTLLSLVESISADDRREIAQTLLTMRAKHRRAVQRVLMHQYPYARAFRLLHGSRRADYYPDAHFTLKEPTFFTPSAETAHSFAGPEGKVISADIPIERIESFDVDDAEQPEVVAAPGEYEKNAPDMRGGGARPFGAAGSAGLAQGGRSPEQGPSADGPRRGARLADAEQRLIEEEAPGRYLNGALLKELGVPDKEQLLVTLIGPGMRAIREPRAAGPEQVGLWDEFLLRYVPNAVVTVYQPGFAAVNAWRDLAKTADGGKIRAVSKDYFDERATLGVPADIFVMDKVLTNFRGGEGDWIQNRRLLANVIDKMRPGDLQVLGWQYGLEAEATQLIIDETPNANRLKLVMRGSEPLTAGPDLRHGWAVYRKDGARPFGAAGSAGLAQGGRSPEQGPSADGPRRGARLAENRPLMIRRLAKLVSAALGSGASDLQSALITDPKHIQQDPHERGKEELTQDFAGNAEFFERALEALISDAELDKLDRKLRTLGIDLTADGFETAEGYDALVRQFRLHMDKSAMFGSLVSETAGGRSDLQNYVGSVHWTLLSWPEIIAFQRLHGTDEEYVSRRRRTHERAAEALFAGTLADPSVNALLLRYPHLAGIVHKEFYYYLWKWPSFLDGIELTGAAVAVWPRIQIKVFEELKSIVGGYLYRQEQAEPADMMESIRQIFAGDGSFQAAQQARADAVEQMLPRIMDLLLSLLTGLKADFLVSYPKWLAAKARHDRQLELGERSWEVTKVLNTALQAPAPSAEAIESGAGALIELLTKEKEAPFLSLPGSMLSTLGEAFEYLYLNGHDDMLTALARRLPALFTSIRAATNDPEDGHHARETLTHLSEVLKVVGAAYVRRVPGETAERGEKIKMLSDLLEQWSDIRIEESESGQALSVRTPFGTVSERLSARDTPSEEAIAEFRRALFVLRGELEGDELIQKAARAAEGARPLGETRGARLAAKAPSRAAMLRVIRSENAHLVEAAQPGEPVFGLLLTPFGGQQSRYLDRLEEGRPLTESERKFWLAAANDGVTLSASNIPQPINKVLKRPKSAQRVVVTKYGADADAALLEETLHLLEPSAGSDSPEAASARENVNALMQLLFRDPDKQKPYRAGYPKWSLGEARALRKEYLTDGVDPERDIPKVIARLAEDIRSGKKLIFNRQYFSVKYLFLRELIARFNAASSSDEVSENALERALLDYLDAFQKDNGFGRHTPLFVGARLAAAPRGLESLWEKPAAKVILADFDNTAALTTAAPAAEHPVSDRTRGLIRDFVAAGGEFSILSTRAAEHIRQRLGIPDVRIYGRFGAQELEALSAQRFRGRHLSIHELEAVLKPLAVSMGLLDPSAELQPLTERAGRNPDMDAYRLGDFELRVTTPRSGPQVFATVSMYPIVSGGTDPRERMITELRKSFPGLEAAIGGRATINLSLVNKADLVAHRYLNRLDLEPGQILVVDDEGTENGTGFKMLNLASAGVTSVLVGKAEPSLDPRVIISDKQGPDGLNRILEIEIAKRRLEKLKAALDIGSPALQQLSDDMLEAMRQAGAQPKGPFWMLPSGILAAGQSRDGRYVAVELGGTKLRAGIVAVAGGQPSLVSMVSYPIPDALKSAPVNDLFDWVAGVIRRIDPQGLPVGFAFTFPIRRDPGGAMRLVEWRKGFSAEGIEGRHIGEMLGQALERAGAKGPSVAVANDAVAVAALSGDIGFVHGTGANAAVKDPATGEFVDVTLGNFDRFPDGTLTAIDDRINDTFGYPPADVPKRRFSKMVAGRHLGELARLALEEVFGRPVLKPRAIETRMLAAPASIPGLLPDEAFAARVLSEPVQQRSASVFAAAVVATVRFVDPALSRAHVIPVDGSVYRSQPGYAARVDRALGELLGDRSDRVRLAAVENASLLGAALIAAKIGRGAQPLGGLGARLAQDLRDMSREDVESLVKTIRDELLASPEAFNPQTLSTAILYVLHHYVPKSTDLFEGTWHDPRAEVVVRQLFRGRTSERATRTLMFLVYRSLVIDAGTERQRESRNFLHRLEERVAAEPDEEALSKLSADELSRAHERLIVIQDQAEREIKEHQPKEPNEETRLLIAHVREVIRDKTDAVVAELHRRQRSGTPPDTNLSGARLAVTSDGVYERFLDDPYVYGGLLFVGASKPLGFLTMKVLGESVDSFKIWADEKGLRWRVSADKLYVYDAAAVSRILDSFGELLVSKGVPTDPSGFIDLMASRWINDKALERVIAYLFADRRYMHEQAWGSLGLGNNAAFDQNLTMDDFDRVRTLDASVQRYLRLPEPERASQTFGHVRFYSDIVWLVRAHRLSRAEAVWLMKRADEFRTGRATHPEALSGSLGKPMPGTLTPEDLGFDPKNEFVELDWGAGVPIKRMLPPDGARLAEPSAVDALVEVLGLDKSRLISEREVGDVRERIVELPAGHFLRTEIASNAVVNYRAIYRRGTDRLLALIPDIRSTQTADYLDLTPYQVPLAMLRNVFAYPDAVWNEQLTRYQKDQDALQGYLSNVLSPVIQKRLSQYFNDRTIEYIWVESDKAAMDLASFSLERLIDHIQRSRRMGRSANPGIHTLVYPLYPSVYSPAEHRSSDYGLTEELSDQLSKAPIANGDRVLDAATGSGYLTWLSWRTLRSRGIEPTFYAFDINPFAVANARALAAIAGYTVDVRRADSLYDDRNVPLFADAERNALTFRVIVSNNPAFPKWDRSKDEPRLRQPRRFDEYWDSGAPGFWYGNMITRALPRILAPEGLALLWNAHEDADEDRFGSMLLKTGLHVDLSAIKIDGVSVYIVKHPAGARLALRRGNDNVVALLRADHSPEQGPSADGPRRGARLAAIRPEQIENFPTHELIHGLLRAAQSVITRYAPQSIELSPNIPPSAYQWALFSPHLPPDDETAGWEMGIYQAELATRDDLLPALERVVNSGSYLEYSATAWAVLAPFIQRMEYDLFRQAKTSRTIKPLTRLLNVMSAIIEWDRSAGAYTQTLHQLLEDRDALTQPQYSDPAAAAARQHLMDLKMDPSFFERHIAYRLRVSAEDDSEYEGMLEQLLNEIDRIFVEKGATYDEELGMIELSRTFPFLRKESYADDEPGAANGARLSEVFSVKLPAFAGSIADIPSGFVPMMIGESAVLAPAPPAGARLAAKITPTTGGNQQNKSDAAKRFADSFKRSHGLAFTAKADPRVTGGESVHLLVVHDDRRPEGERALLRGSQNAVRAMFGAGAEFTEIDRTAATVQILSAVARIRRADPEKRIVVIGAFDPKLVAVTAKSQVGLLTWESDAEPGALYPFTSIFAGAMITQKVARYADLSDSERSGLQTLFNGKFDENVFNAVRQVRDSAYNYARIAIPKLAKLPVDRIMEGARLALSSLASAA